ncbi:hypothetical protein [Streptomyces smyrnaeus]|uniref:hypothetical protein n=1 Tax=Streptomyces smyrnaeus TaxID=1387713 RepID=UPI0036B751C6
MDSKIVNLAPVDEAAAKVATSAATALHRKYPHLDPKGLAGEFPQGALKVAVTRYIEDIERGVSPTNAADEADETLIRVWEDARTWAEKRRAARSELERDQALCAGVFAAAMRGVWRETNLGALTEVVGGGYTWTVNLPPARLDEDGQEVPVKARITGRHGYGGIEDLSIDATWGQTAGIVDAVMAARRVH